MSANSRARILSALAAGLTVTALVAATTVPAWAEPVLPSPNESSAKLQLPDGRAASRVIAGRYLVETVATPLSRGGGKLASQAAAKATTTAVRAAGATVTSSSAELWSGVAVTATEAQIRVLAQSPSVKAVYPVLRVDLPRTTRSATTASSALHQISALGLGQDGSGIKVGVIDTGIDIDNRDLGGAGKDDDTSFPTARVAYGWDFVGDAYDSDDANSSTPVPDSVPDDCEGHGTHVAGIIGASGIGDAEATSGVAPNVTLGAYRVFGCSGSTDTAVILSALNLAKAQGMHVVNLSLGSDFDSWPSYPDAVAAANLAKSGVVVVVSAGNSGDTGLFSAGSPAVGAGTISVASYETDPLRARAISVLGAKYAYSSVAGTAPAPFRGEAQPLQVVPSLTGCSAAGGVGTVPAGTAVLIKRGGDCTFHEKVRNAAAAGAGAVVFYNDRPGLDSFSARGTDGSGFNIPAISINGTDGTNLAAALAVPAADPTMTWLAAQSDLANPDAGFLSRFSSAGIAADLSLVPTITAPGGKIYSTLPVEQGEHGNMSGTSMAAPYVAGAAALMLQAQPGLIGRPATVAQRLYNTATPVLKNTELGTAQPEAVFRQGSGLVNVAGALAIAVTASPSTIRLGEGKSHKVKISLTNRTAGTLTYRVSRVSGVSAAASTASGGTVVGTTTPNYSFGEVGFKARRSVTVKAGKTVRVTVRLTAPRSVLRGRPGMLYGGWVQFTTVGAGNTVSVPFVGLRGDYQAVRLLNRYKYAPAEGAPWTLPALGYVVGSGQDAELVPEYGAGHVFYDNPYLLYHLDYPASDVQLKVTSTRSKKSYYAILDPSSYNPYTQRISRKSTHLYRVSRDASAQYLELIGVYHKGQAYGLGSGTWKMQLRVLKPLGRSSKGKHWETFTTVVFRIA